MIPATVSVTPASTGCEVQASTLTWGFKESFRSYISGSIANGEWTVADGATYETPSFGWAGGTGTYDVATSEGLIAFAGSIDFTGHGGILNTTIANPQVRFVDSDTAMLLVDVTGTTQEGAAVSQTGVEFVELDLSGATALNDGVLTVTDAPATLTDAGSEAFGTYEAGEPFDPVNLEVSMDSTCATIAQPESPVAPAADLTWLWIGGGVVVIAAIAALVAVTVRRRRGV